MTRIFCACSNIEMGSSIVAPKRVKITIIIITDGFLIHPGLEIDPKILTKISENFDVDFYYDFLTDFW